MYAQQQKLKELDTALERDRDIVSKINSVSSCIKAITRADRCTIFIHDPETRSLWSAYIDGLSFLELPDDKGVVGKVFATGESVLAEDVSQEKSYFGRIDQTTGYHTRSMICIALCGFGGHRIGVVQLLNKQDGTRFDQSDLEALRLVLKHIEGFASLIAYKAA